MFEEFPKIARLSRECVITEKIDGTNAQVFIVRDDGDLAIARCALGTRDGLAMLAGSRTQFITPERDNHGFARWVAENCEALWDLGEGRHFGEWWGSGIQRGYGLQKGEKRFSLFNVGRWVETWRDGCRGPLGEKQQYAPECCRVVPILWSGAFTTDVAEGKIEWLRLNGSKAAPGFMNPEGIVIWHEAARQMFKKTLERDSEPKSKHVAA